MNVGDYIDQALLADGGDGPYQWEASQLPEGLSCRPWGSIHGLIAQSVTGDSTADLIVHDASGNTCSKTVPVRLQRGEDLLALLGFRDCTGGTFREPSVMGEAEFCIIPGGFFAAGYHATPERNHWIKILDTQGLDITLAQVQTHWLPGIPHLDTFLMQRFEVTNAQYAEFLHEAKYTPPGHWTDGQPPRGKERHPVVNVMFEDVQAYCQWKTQKARQAGLPLTYRLPTHWQWEKAARGRTYPTEAAARQVDNGRLYPWGDSWSNERCNDIDADVGGTTDVGAFAMGHDPFGVCDLAGNVTEWVDGGRYEDDQVWQHSRGASWTRFSALEGLTFYYGLLLRDPRRCHGDLGFRCVIEVESESRPLQTLVPLGNCRFPDADGRTQFVGYPFYMARFAVTNEEYAEFRPAHPFDSSRRWCPAVNISHADAVAYCYWKSQQDGRFYRLPTLVEWQCACRGTRGRTYPWGDEYSSYLCNSVESGWGRTVNVWSLWQGATPDGIYHLCGNTFEWLQTGLSIGGSWRQDCRKYGAPPYTRVDVAGQPTDEIGFRYVAIDQERGLR